MICPSNSHFCAELSGTVTFTLASGMSQRTALAGGVIIPLKVRIQAVCPAWSECVLHISGETGKGLREPPVRAVPSKVGRL
jgi:hypothetical protein